MQRNTPKQPVRMVYARPDGSILDHPTLHMAARGGAEPRSPQAHELVPLPRGSDLFLLPGRTPIGLDRSTAQPVPYEEDGVCAVAAFLAPAWTLFLHPAYRSEPGAAVLPLFAYAAVGFADGKFWTTGLRVDADTRQDPWRFDNARLQGQIELRVREHPDNPVVAQLQRCASEYNCRAAQNFFIGRHEAPIPTSVTCNSRCVGCISLQADGSFKASHERVKRPPQPKDVAELALAHLARVPDGVVSFGQGCEGEPLLGEALLPEATRLIRAGNRRGIININTNGSRPDVVDAMCIAGLDAIRVSLNSPRKALYDAYYRPANYDFDALKESLAVMRRHGRYRSINYLVFPGVTDTEAEFEAMCDFVSETDLELIQMRNLNIDPELYARTLPAASLSEGFGLDEFMRRLRRRFPHLRYGYFNPNRPSWQAMRAARAAHAQSS